MKVYCRSSLRHERDGMDSRQRGIWILRGLQGKSFLRFGFYKGIQGDLSCMFAIALPRQKLLIQVNSKIGQNRWLLNWPLKTGFACIEVHGATLFTHRGWCQVSGGESNKQLVPRRYSKKKEGALAGRSTCSALVLRVWLGSEQQEEGQQIAGAPSWD